MKKVYLAFIYIITIVCIVVGIVIHTSRWSGFNFIKPSNMKYEDYDADLTNVKDDITITIDCRLGDVKIKKGSKFHLSYKAVTQLETKVTTDENTISIIQKSEVTNWGNNMGSDITLTIPENVNIVKLDVHNDLGDIDIEGLTFEEGIIDENLGDIDIEKCSFTDIDVNNDLGDIKIIDCGSFEDYKIDADVSLGEIKFFGNKCGDEYYVDGTKGSIKVSNSLGDITIK